MHIAHQRRRGDRGGASTRIEAACSRARPAPRPPPHAAARPDGRRGRSSAAWPQLGLCANLFANHICYWGDAAPRAHHGPRPRQPASTPAAPRWRRGVPLAIHSDAPVTPLGPLFTAWCAVNRVTPERPAARRRPSASPWPEALRAITHRRGVHADARPPEIGTIEMRQARRLLRARRRPAGEIEPDRAEGHARVRRHRAVGPRVRGASAAEKRLPHT
jgi:hypothetical protein